jgi:hypothetical protein
MIGDDENWRLVHILNFSGLFNFPDKLRVIPEDFAEFETKNGRSLSSNLMGGCAGVCHRSNDSLALTSKELDYRTRNSKALGRCLPVDEVPIWYLGPI